MCVADRTIDFASFLKWVIMDELDLKIREFEALSPAEITVDRLRPMMYGYKVIGTMCFPPLNVYRARRASGFPRWNQVQDLSYPNHGSASRSNSRNGRNSGLTGADRRAQY